jgi:hypothetical protein
MNFFADRFHKSWGKFWHIWVTNSFWGRTHLHGVSWLVSNSECVAPIKVKYTSLYDLWRLLHVPVWMGIVSLSKNNFVNRPALRTEQNSSETRSLPVWKHLLSYIPLKTNLDPLFDLKKETDQVYETCYLRNTRLWTECKSPLILSVSLSEPLELTWVHIMEKFYRIRLLFWRVQCK